MRRLGAALAVAALALGPTPAHAADLAWEPWQAIPGAVDVDGPRTDGSLVVAGSAALYLVNPDGTKTDFARGPGGYHEDPGTEAYLAMSTGGHVSAANCDWVPDETFILRLSVPIGIKRVSSSGDDSGPFASIPQVRVLTGIAFDSVGAFDHRLLVLGLVGSKPILFAVDCSGSVQVITRAAPVPEGGMAVAPEGFGSFGGELILPNETNGAIYAVAPDGSVKVVVKPPATKSLGASIESVGFVPAGFMSRGGALYYADHKTAGSSFPGTDTILRLTSAQLASAGVQDGDMLAANESGAGLIAVRCGTSCAVTDLIKPGKGHGEGHLTFSMAPLPPSPEPVNPAPAQRAGLPPQLVAYVGRWGIPTTAFLLLVALLASVGAQAIRRRRR
jgi:hypothetical protein